MDDGIGPEPVKELEHAFAITNIQLMMDEVRELCLKPPLIPSRVAAGTEKLAPPVVVYTMDCPTVGGKVRTDF